MHMQHSQMLNMPKYAIWQCFHHQLLKSALETQIKAYAVVANVQLAKKLYLAVFSSSTFEINSRNAYIGICISRKCSTCRKTHFGSVFIINFRNILQKSKYKHMQHSQMLQIPKKAIWQCFHHQLFKSLLETQIKAHAVVANVKHAEIRYVAVFSSSTFEICSRNANRGICSICKY